MSDHLLEHCNAQYVMGLLNHPVTKGLNDKYKKMEGIFFFRICIIQHCSENLYMTLSCF